MKYRNPIDHQYTLEQARLLLAILQDQTAETLRPSTLAASPEAVNAALDKLRLELMEFIETDDGFGLIVPSRDDKGLL